MDLSGFEVILGCFLRPSSGERSRRSANSFWNMSTAQRKAGRCAKSLKVKGEEILFTL